MPHNVDVHVGHRLKERRIFLGMSQGDLAQEVGITFQQVQKYERGTNRMGASRLYEFSRVLSVPIGYFFDGLEVAETSIATPTGMAEESAAFVHEVAAPNRETLEFVRSYQRIKDKKQRKALGAYIRSIADGKTVVEE